MALQSQNNLFITVKDKTKTSCVTRSNIVQDEVWNNDAMSGNHRGLKT